MSKNTTSFFRAKRPLFLAILSCGFLTSSAFAVVATGGVTTLNSLIGTGSKVASRSLSSSSDSSSDSSNSTSRQRDPIYGLNFQTLPTPKLASQSFAPLAAPALRFEGVFSCDQQKSIESEVARCALDFRFSNEKELVVKTSTHPTLTRRGLTARMTKGMLLINAEQLHSKQLPQEVALALARESWELLSEENQQKWTQLAGLSTLPLLPITTKKWRFSSYEKENAQVPENSREDFALSLLLHRDGKTELLSPSRRVFLSQICGETQAKNTPAAIAQIENTRIYFAFVSKKGAVGSSQGHCGLVVEKDGKKLAMAYVATDFDYDHALKSCMKALVGQSQRGLEFFDFDAFEKQYQEESRSVSLSELPLSFDEKTRLLFRLTESIEGEKGNYSFFRQNCATGLRDLLAYSLNDSSLNIWHSPESLRGWAELKVKEAKIDKAG